MEAMELNMMINETIEARLIEAKKIMAGMNILKGVIVKISDIDAEAGEKFRQSALYLIMAKPEIKEIEIVAKMYGKMLSSKLN